MPESAYPYRPEGQAGQPSGSTIERLIQLIELADLANLRQDMVRINRKLDKLMSDVSTDFADLDSAVQGIQAAVQAVADRVTALINSSTITGDEKTALENDVAELQAAASALGNVAPSAPADGTTQPGQANQTA